MDVPKYAQIAFVVVIIITVILYGKNYFQNNESVSVQEVSKVTSETFVALGDSDRPISIEQSATLPIQNIVQNTQVKHSIPLDEIRQGCARQDCIPSVDKPKFESVVKASKVLEPESIGIALSYKDEERFYPFPMLETHELVNDIVAGDPLLISYCPLCGTGIVFSRTVDGVVYEFGVSGMLWQSNLLMYNRSDVLGERNLWSQVLGEAVVGDKTGRKLVVVTSDIMKFDEWAKQNPLGSVLTTGDPRDPYGGEYYSVAQRFAPSFVQKTSPLAPDSYVYGIEVNGTYKAYPRDLLLDGEFRDMINDEEITVVNTQGKVVFTDADGEVITDVEGFWFSWSAVHPESLIWNN